MNLFRVCLSAIYLILAGAAAQADCIKLKDSRSLNNINVYATNTCSSPKRVEICMTIALREPVKTAQNSAVIDVGKTTRFNFVDFDNSAYEYLTRACGAKDVCPAECPNLAGAVPHIEGDWCGEYEDGALLRYSFSGGHVAETSEPESWPIGGYTAHGSVVNFTIDNKRVHTEFKFTMQDSKNATLVKHRLNKADNSTEVFTYQFSKC